MAELGPGVCGFAVGDAVIGFSMRRSSHAEYVTVSANQLTPRPATVPWEVAGSLFGAGVTTYAAVRAVRLAPGDTVAIAGAAGGVGSTISMRWSGSESSRQAGRMPRLRRWSPSWPTSSHAVNWKCRSPEPLPSMMCETLTDSSNCAIPAATVSDWGRNRFHSDPAGKDVEV